MKHPWFSRTDDALILMGRPFVKMHGLRNHFVIVDGRETPYSPSVAEITHICDPCEGVGADTLIVIETPCRKSAASGVTAFMRIFNADGREVEACGNATRCVGWLLLQENELQEITIQTLGGQLKCRDAGNKLVAVEMGRLRTRWQEIPVLRQMDTLHLGIGAGPLQDPVGMNIGNPHAVFFVNDLASVDLSHYGPELQSNPLFPQGANIGVAQLIDQQTLKLSVWERPGILTTACGSGACAAVGAAYRRGLTTEKRMTVIMPGGSVEIELKDAGTVLMTGPVETCYAGFLPVIK